MRRLLHLFHQPLWFLPAAVLILFWPALTQPFSILYPTFSQFSDTMVIHWPKAYLLAQTWQAQGEVAHWTPLILSGMPLAANQLAMLFYPPAWLFLILPPEPVFNLLLVGHFLLGGVGLYFLLRQGYNLSPLASLLGSLTFALNGKWVAHAAGGHVSMVGAIGWMPWALFGLTMLLKVVWGKSRTSLSLPDSGEGRTSLSLSYKRIVEALGWAALIGLSVAMQITTHTLPVIYTAYLLGAMVIWSFVSHFRLPLTPRNYLIQGILISFFLLGIGFLLAGLLGAAQLLPLLELAQYSNRSLSLAEATTYSLSLTEMFIGLLLPTGRAGHELIIYLGLVPLLLLPLSLSRQQRWSWFYGGLFLFVLLFALGPLTPLHSLFYYFAPGFRWVRTPARIFFVGALVTAILVGFAVERLSTVSWPAATQKWLMRLVIGLGLLALFLGIGLAVTIEPLRRSGLALALIVPLALALLLLQSRAAGRRSLLIGLLGAVLALDLLWFDLSLIHFVPRSEALASGQAVAEYLAQKPGLFRTYSPSYSLPMQTAAAHGLQLADGVEPVHLAVYDQYMAQAGGYRDARFTVTIPPFGDAPLETALKGVKPDLKLLGLLNVQYLAAAFPMEQPGLQAETILDGTYVYRNEQALPRAWVAHQAVPVTEDWLAQLEELPSLADVVLVEAGAAGSNSNLSASPANITGYSADVIEMETTVAEPGWLVTSELWYPGWQATLNGQPQPVEKVNGFLRGLYLDQPGSYQIRLEYRPRSVIWGSWISGVTGVGLLVMSIGALLVHLRLWGLGR